MQFLFSFFSFFFKTNLCLQGSVLQLHSDSYYFFEPCSWKVRLMFRFLDLRNLFLLNDDMAVQQNLVLVKVKIFPQKEYTSPLDFMVTSFLPLLWFLLCIILFSNWLKFQLFHYLIKQIIITSYLFSVLVFSACRIIMIHNGEAGRCQNVQCYCRHGQLLETCFTPVSCDLDPTYIIYCTCAFTIWKAFLLVYHMYFPF